MDVLVIHAADFYLIVTRKALDTIGQERIHKDQYGLDSDPHLGFIVNLQKASEDQRGSLWICVDQFGFNRDRH